MQDEAQKRNHCGSAYPIPPLTTVDGVFGMDNYLFSRCVMAQVATMDFEGLRPAWT